MADRTDWELPAAYLAGENRDKDKIEAWLNADPENKQTLQLLQKVMDTPEILPKEPDVDALWQGVAERTDLAKQVPRVETAGFRRYWKYAAAILLVIALGWMVKMVAPGMFTGQQQEWREMKIEKGKKGGVTLADGTAVSLDAGSTLRYPTEFNGPTRTVYLQGEGYFEVTPNREKEFKVFAGQAVVTVKGTRFNVRAWQGTLIVKVAVLEGKVSLNNKHAHAAQEVLITKGQFSVLPGSGLPAKPQTGDINKLLGWMKRDMAFENAALIEILDQLERWYDVDMDLTSLDQAGAEERLTLHLREGPLEDILELIGALTDVTYKREGRKVYLYSKSSKPKKEE
jgi:ferric-dicitrate binding protein FerR (iron transport regulator)